MNRYYCASSESVVMDKETNIEFTREYFKQLLNKSYSDQSLTTDDAIAMASLASALDEFLSNDETERRAALTLKNNLYQIVSNSSWNNKRKHPQTKETPISSNTFYTSDGKVVYLGILLGSGGEGSVYKIPNMPGKVAKVFKPSTNVGYMERKIEAIIDNQIPSRLENILISTMPETLLYDEKDKFVGYVMPWITTKFKFMDVARNSATRKTYFPDLDYKGLIIIAYNLAEVVDYLHGHGVVIGDLNNNNIIINPDGTVCLIDTDSYDIVDKKTKEHFQCKVGVPELLAPELQTVGNLKNGHFTKETDAFSLAILIFRLMMSNADPFSGTRTIDTSKSLNILEANLAIINGKCPYVKTVEGIKVPDWVPSFDTLPIYIQELFVRAFDYTSKNYKEKIATRPTAKEWMVALARFYNEPLKHCERDSFHWYRSELDACPFCARINTALPVTAEIKRKKKGVIENLKSIITVEI